MSRTVSLFGREDEAGSGGGGTPEGPARQDRTIMEGKFERIIVTADVRRKWNI